MNKLAHIFGEFFADRLLLFAVFCLCIGSLCLNTGFNIWYGSINYVQAEEYKGSLHTINQSILSLHWDITNNRLHQQLETIDKNIFELQRLIDKNEARERDIAQHNDLSLEREKIMEAIRHHRNLKVNP